MKTQFICVLFWLVLFSLVPSLFLVHHDLGWHIRAGELISTEKSIPSTDPWSFTASGYPWLNLSWLWDIHIWQLYSLGGILALVVSSIVLASLTLGLAASLSPRIGAEGLGSFLASALAGCAILTFEPPDNPFAVSPQAFSLFLLAGMNLLLLHPTISLSRKLLFAAGLELLWSNSHGGFPAGIIAVSSFILCNLNEFRRQFSVPVFLATIGVFAAPLFTPIGFSIIEAVRRSVDHPSVPFITEWEAFRPGNSWLMSALIGAFLPAILFTRKNSDLRPLFLQGVFWLFLGLNHQRHLSLFAVLAVPAAALVLSTAIFRLSFLKRLSLLFSGSIGFFLPLAIVGYSLFLPLIVTERMHGEVNWTSEMDPREEIAYLLRSHPGERVFNEWNFGAFLIFHAPGKIPVYIDGRAGTAYPPELFTEYVRDYLSPGGDWQSLLDRHRLNLALVAKYRLRALEFFRQHRCWERTFEGKAAVLFKRRNEIGCQLSSQAL